MACILVEKGCWILTDLRIESFMMQASLEQPKDAQNDELQSPQNRHSNQGDDREK
jgi:hypothetical protein